ncbi:cobalamin biosynthesis protein [Desulfovibrio porci]|uniref:cobalt-precorrin 5A hydrolase n=1 Tax=Desulfovibrio porci TaxID=2605782 RepID=UPI001E3F3434|nr:cobalamin biosynthesis protein [Desulfovibrio porci]
MSQRSSEAGTVCCVDAEAVPALLCHALSRDALPLARRLAARLPAAPWCAPDGRNVATCRISAPARLAEADICPFDDLAAFLAREYRRHTAHVFVGATGIAVRVLAPLLRHKSQDPPVVVLDPAGRFVISLLSGHWGGGNALARHLAVLLQATPVITTASDQTAEQDRVQAAIAPAALDLLIRDAGLRILDWERLPQAQAALLEGRPLRLWDPCRALPAALPPRFERLPEDWNHEDDARETLPLLAAHWRHLPPSPGLLRLAVPRLYAGLGCRRGIPKDAALAALTELCGAHDLELQAVASLATVTEKADEPALRATAARLRIPLRTFPAGELARCATPNPSEAAGRRFNQPPFSVCEASALLAARADGHSAGLLLPKTAIQSCLTIAVALAVPVTPTPQTA